MFLNGAGTGMAITYQAVRLKQVRRLGLSAVLVAAAGSATTAASRLLTGTASTRTSGTTALASVLCVRQKTSIV